MPRKEINDYIFYKIVCLDNSVELCYVGSTANWKERQRNHKSSCNNENSKKYNTKIYKTIRENGGWINFKMVEIGKKEQLTKRQAEQIEDVYRDELKADMNMRRCYRTAEQKREHQKEYDKNYRDRDKINEKQREKVKCECGCMIIKNYLSKHQKRLKHIILMENKKHIDLMEKTGNEN
jgi:hypothetical protein